MALIKCPECSREVSQEAFACPGCGKPLRSPFPWFGKKFAKYMVATWALLIVAFLLVYKLFSPPQQAPGPLPDRGSSSP